ncbi:hypothetical protein [Streptomyces sp. SP18CS02]|uniref:hypothetical protein n=1 Tax=Streptomyces sp. SP18CS02 TaxID=3002531 RepID=UPI002E76E6E9|nr:hypothetical protein [Streptomyces sp. SP18CS02]MEE1753566.1 hypothetical protein [Streptomyces sp. SP18CS02]
MTTPRTLPEPAVRRGSRTIRMGDWTFTPAVAYSPQGSSATLRHGDQCISLRHTSTLLEDFLGAVGRIQADFIRLTNAAGASVGHGGECVERGIHA